MRLRIRKGPVTPRATFRDSRDGQWHHSKSLSVRRHAKPRSQGFRALRASKSATSRSRPVPYTRSIGRRAIQSSSVSPKPGHSTINSRTINELIDSGSERADVPLSNGIACTVRAVTEADWRCLAPKELAYHIYSKPSSHGRVYDGFYVCASGRPLSSLWSEEHHSDMLAYQFACGVYRHQSLHRRETVNAELGLPERYMALDRMWQRRQILASRGRSPEKENQSI